MKPTEKLQLLELPPEAGYKMNLGAKLCTIKKKVATLSLLEHSEFLERVWTGYNFSQYFFLSLYRISASYRNYSEFT